MSGTEARISPQAAEEPFTTPELLAFFAAMQEVVMVLDVEGRHLRVAPTNPAALHRPAAELVGKTLHDVFSATEADRCLTYIREVLAGGESVTMEYRVVVDSRERWYCARISPLSAGQVIWVARDITDHKNVEMQFRQAQKMEAVGTLAAGVAHDFNNMLTIVTGYSHLLLAKFPAEDDVCRAAQEINKAATRAATLTRQLLAYSRRQVLEPSILDLNSLVANTEKVLRRVIGEDIQLVTVLAQRLGWVKADAGQLEQVIFNLALNAREAMPSGGKLTIETSNIELDEDYARRHVSARPGSYVMMAISDTGCGMPRDVQARIFEPFFTTKGQGKGTGLGLAAVYGIVKQSGGYIWVYSEPGHGTTFKIYLPRADRKTQTEAEPQATELPRGSETILLVEDSEPVRRLVSDCLQQAGYTVLQAKDASEAVEIAAAHHGRIQLMLSDVVMPQVSGPELAEYLSSLRPDMKVLYMSGYTDEGIVRHGILEAGTAFIQKPFTPVAIATKVREVLDKSVA